LGPPGGAHGLPSTVGPPGGVLGLLSISKPSGGAGGLASISGPPGGAHGLASNSGPPPCSASSTNPPSSVLYAAFNSPLSSALFSALNNPPNPPTSASASHFLPIPTPHVPEKQEDWADCVDLTEDEDDEVSTGASSSMPAYSPPSHRQQQPQPQQQRPQQPQQQQPTPSALYSDAYFFHCQVCFLRSRRIQEMIGHLIGSHGLTRHSLHRHMAGFSCEAEAGYLAGKLLCLACFAVVTNDIDHYRYHAGDKNWSLDNLYIAIQNR